MHLIIVRHGETEWTLSGQHTGKTDLALTEHGRYQAASLRPVLRSLLKNQNWSAYSSPRTRAIETAGLALPEASPQIEPLIEEFDYGIYEGKTFDEITTINPSWNIWTDGCPEGESVADVASRADQFLEKYVKDSSDSIVIFTHGHFSRILVTRALGIDPTVGSLLVNSPGSISVVEESHGQPCLGVWNASADLINTIHGPR